MLRNQGKNRWTTTRSELDFFLSKPTLYFGIEVLVRLLRHDSTKLERLHDVGNPNICGQKVYSLCGSCAVGPQECPSDGCERF